MEYTLEVFSLSFCPWSTFFLRFSLASKLTLACLAPNMENWTPAVASLPHATWWMTDHQVFQNVSWKAQKSCCFNYASWRGILWSGMQGVWTLLKFLSLPRFCKEISLVLWKLQQAWRHPNISCLFSFLASLHTFKQAFLCFARGFGAPGPCASQQLAKVQAKTSIQEESIVIYRWSVGRWRAVGGCQNICMFAYYLFTAALQEEPFEL